MFKISIHAISQTVRKQNLTNLKGNSQKKIQSHRIFRPFYNRFYEEININHTLLWFSQGMAKQRKEGSFRERKVPFAKGRFFLRKEDISGVQGDILCI